MEDALYSSIRNFRKNAMRKVTRGLRTANEERNDKKSDINKKENKKLNNDSEVDETEGYITQTDNELSFNLISTSSRYVYLYLFIYFLLPFYYFAGDIKLSYVIFQSVVSLHQIKLFILLQ